MPAEPALAEPAQLPLDRLQSLWFQITGLLCNLECTHCLVDSSPRNRSMAFLERSTVRAILAEAAPLGLKEAYFTGGEPFLHKEMTGILEDTLHLVPATVLTNGTLLTERLAATLGAVAAGWRFSLEIRVSMDHPDPERNDAVRGPGTHAKAMRALSRLEANGLLPIVTATEFVLGQDPTESPVYAEFLDMLRRHGISRPRLKILPVFHTGKLEDPNRGGTITREMLQGLDPELLQCSATRLVAADGIYACPILAGVSEARISRAEGLRTGLAPVTLSHHACRTCYETGMTCSNY